MELKFRAYNTIVKRIQYFSIKDLEKQQGIIQWQNLHIDQYTGLKDIKGIDIYEGDLITGDYMCSHVIGVVERNNFGGYLIKAYPIGHDNPKNMSISLVFSYGNVIKIGNIRQDYQLLNLP